MTKSMKYIISSFLFSSPLFGGNESVVGGGKALTVEELAMHGNDSGVGGGGGLEELLSRIPAESLFKDAAGRTMIPLTADNIRRLNIRASVDGKTTLTLDDGEKFNLSLDAEKKLIDFKKAAEVIDRAKLVESQPE